MWATSPVAPTLSSQTGTASHESGDAIPEVRLPPPDGRDSVGSAWWTRLDHECGGPHLPERTAGVVQGAAVVEGEGNAGLQVGSHEGAADRDR